MSSPNHPTANIEDAFSLNFLDFIPASPDYVPTSPGKTFSNSSNSFGVVPIASSSLLLLYEDPYMKAFPLLVRKFPLLEETSHCLKKNATASRKVLPLPEVCTAIIVKEKPSVKDDSTTSGDKSGRTVTLTTEDTQKKNNDVKARTTLLLSLPDEHQLQFSKHKTAKELWAAILKTFSGNEATKKTKKNLLKQYNVPTASANVATVSISQETTCAYIAFQSDGSQIKFEDINQINEDDMEEMDIKWNMALLSMRADKFWKNISIQGSDVAGFDKSKVECFECYKMGHFVRECKAPRNQERGRRHTYRQGSKAEEHSPKALMEIDGVGWDWSYMENDEKDHALVAEAPTEFALMADTSTENK
nr:hypothetical protein [Tanacetum cinerariifolium]